MINTVQISDCRPRIIYFDSSAILSWFLEQEGGKIVEDIFNFRDEYFTISLSISITVYDEIIKKVENLYGKDIPRFNKFKNYLSKFYISNYTDDLVEIELENKKDELIKKYPTLGKRINSGDLNILSELIFYLGIFKGPSHPILISCDNDMIEILKKENYRVFNPRKDKINNFKSIINER